MSSRVHAGRLGPVAVALAVPVVVALRVEVAGDAYELGYQHGAQASGLIERYLLWIERLTGQPRDVLCGRALAFLPYMERLSPAFVTEVRGLAKGAGIEPVYLSPYIQRTYFIGLSI